MAWSKAAMVGGWSSALMGTNQAVCLTVSMQTRSVIHSECRQALVAGNTDRSAHMGYSLRGIPIKMSSSNSCFQQTLRSTHFSWMIKGLGFLLQIYHLQPWNPGMLFMSMSSSSSFSTLQSSNVIAVIFQHHLNLSPQLVIQQPPANGPTGLLQSSWSIATFGSFGAIYGSFYLQKSIWLVVWTPLKNMKVNWDDEIPNINGKIKLMFQTTNQQSRFPPLGVLEHRKALSKARSGSQRLACSTCWTCSTSHGEPLQNGNGRRDGSGMWLVSLQKKRNTFWSFNIAMENGWKWSVSNGWLIQIIVYSDGDLHIAKLNYQRAISGWEANLALQVQPKIILLGPEVGSPTTISHGGDWNVFQISAGQLPTAI